jgi:hypothetical protein
MDYRITSKECREAWFEYKKTNPNAKVVSFVAGWNAKEGEPMEFKNAKESFEKAIRSGRLSENENATNYAGLYMYMGHSNSVALFKNIETRKYLK